MQYYIEKIAEIKKLGINTHSLVLTSTAFLSLSQLCTNLAKKSQSVVNFIYDNHEVE
jgi:hypothetical protein